MPRKMSPWASRVLELLADGEWHEQERIYHLAAPLVPPGRAFKRGERARLRKRENPDENPKRIKGDSYVSGARMIVVDSVNHMVVAGRLERFEGHLRKSPHFVPSPFAAEDPSSVSAE